MNNLKKALQFKKMLICQETQREKIYSLALDLFKECAINLNNIPLDAYSHILKCLFELGSYREVRNNKFNHNIKGTNYVLTLYWAAPSRS